MAASFARILAAGAAAALVAALLSSPGGAQGVAPGPGNHTFTVEHGGRTRSYILHVPARAGGTASTGRRCCWSGSGARLAAPCGIGG